MEKHEAMSLQELTKHPWWGVLVSELNIEIDEIETKIFSVRGEKWNLVQYTEDDILRATRNVFKTLLETPAKAIESFDITEIIEEEE